jgi:putative RecB family exonuclease
MGTFNQCPQKFRFSKIDMIPDEPTEATLMGNFVHEVLEHFYVLPPDERSIQHLKRLATVVWEESEWMERVLPWLRDPDRIRMMRWNSWWCLEHIYDVENPKSVHDPKIELELNGDVAGVRIKGFIDRLTFDDSMGTISDYKTGKTPPARFVDDKFLQLKIYATTARDIGLCETEKLELLFLKDGVKFVHRFTEGDYQEAKTYIRTTKDAIDAACVSHEFETRTSRLCDWCAYKNICPAWRKS